MVADVKQSWRFPIAAEVEKRSIKLLRKNLAKKENL